jgi:hypothetical protein
MIPGSREEGKGQVGIFLSTAMAPAIRAAQDSVSESGKLAAPVRFSVDARYEERLETICFQYRFV